MAKDTEKNGDIAKLAVDLGRLVERHGSAPFYQLAELLKDPDGANDLAVILESTAKKPPRATRVRRSSSSKRNRIGISVLNELRLTDPEKHSILSDIRRRLVMGSILPTMGDIRHFAATQGLSIGKATSRDAAITPLLRSLSEHPTPRLVSLLDSLVAQGTDDRSLERWRKLIVKSA